MCAPSLHLTNRERFNLRANYVSLVTLPGGIQGKAVITGFNNRWNSVQMNMRRLERLKNPPAPFNEAQDMLNPSLLNPLSYEYETAALVGGEVAGIYERNSSDPIFLPEGYGLGLILRQNQGFLVTAGPDFLKALEKRHPDSKGIPFMNEVFSKHRGSPRSPIIIQTRRFDAVS